MLSQRINRIQPSPTLAVSARAKAMRALGENVISFDAGEPDFDTPQHIKDAAIAALQQGDTKYTPAAGTPALRSAIARKLHSFNGLDYAPDDIVVSSGGKHSLYNIFQSILDPGDEVIIPAPYWVSYPDQVLLADGVPVVLSAGAETGFKITAAQLELALQNHHRVKAFVMNSPSNPSGAVYSPDHLRQLCEILEKYPDVVVISDELYEHMVYAPATQWSMASFSPEFKNRTVVVQGLSKTYAMTGWRLGWTASNPELARAMGKLQSQSTSNPTSFAQSGGVAALEGPLPTAMLAEFEERGKIIRELLNTLPGFDCPQPEGAFYVFPKVSGVFGKTTRDGRVLHTATDLTNYLLEVAKVAAVAGEGFGAPQHVRFSYANSRENIREGIARIAEALPA